MLNVALVGLLAGTLAIGGGDSKNPQTGDKPVVDNAVPGIFTSSDAQASETPDTVQDTYAFGIANRASPVRLWASYALGTTDTYWNTSGNSDGPVNNIQIAGTDGKIETQRATFGGEIGLPLNIIGFSLGGGAQVVFAKNKFIVDPTQTTTNNGPRIPAGPGFIGTDLSSGSLFNLQGVKVYGVARAGAIGIHGGYIFDQGDDRVNVANPAAGGALLPTTLSNSDGRAAIFYGADFDYPSDRFRLFGGVDYFIIQNGGPDSPTTAENESLRDGDDIINAMFGAGFKVSILELGAALQIQTRLSQPIVGDIGTATGIGSSAATISPYLRLSPPQIPVSIFIKGAVLEEYTEFGYALGGSNSPKPKIGFTAGLTVGFD